MNITPNIGQNEKTIRLVVGGVLVAIAAFTNMVWLALVGIVLLASGFVGYCPAKCLMTNMGCCKKKEGDCSTTSGSCSTEDKPMKKEGCCGGGCHSGQEKTGE